MAGQAILPRVEHQGASFPAQAAEAARQQRVHDSAGVELAVQQVQVVKDRLALYGTGQDVLHLSAAEWKEVLAGVLSSTAFVAGSLQPMLPAWQAWLAGSPGCQEALSIVRHGFSLRFVAPNSRSALHHPEHHARIQEVHHLLRGELSEQEFKAALAQDQPPSVRLRNHKSVSDSAPFVEAALLEGLRSGALSIAAEDEVRLVLPLGVDEDRSGKCRLIYDGRALNLWLAWLPFSYERLLDVQQYLASGDYLTTFDAKSGYYHVGVAVQDRQFLGVSYKGVLLRFNVLPFGLAQACYAYHMVMRRMFQPLRAAGEVLTFYVDDLFVAQRSLSCALYHTLTVLQVYRALGWHLSVAKCQLWPTQCLRFLGLLVDTRSMQFFIPEDKLSHILEALQGILHASATSKRALAKFAGLLASVSPAVLMRRLYLHGIYQIMSGHSTWDQEFEVSHEGLAELRSWLNLRAMHGKRWVRSHHVLRLVGDVSETGFAGYAPDGELPHIVQAFAPAQSALMLQGKFSSTLREILNVQVCIVSACEALGEAVRGMRLVYFGDNLGCITALLRMTGSPDIFAVVKAIYLFALQRGVELDFVWAPRNTPEIVIADQLSRIQDWSAVFLSDTTVQRVCKFFKVTPTLDVFAGAAPGEHKADTFYTLISALAPLV